MDLIEIGWGGMDWIDLVQDRNQCRGLVNTVMHLWVPKEDEKILGGCTTGCLSRRA
jgi:hypothetical protein